MEERTFLQLTAETKKCLTRGHLRDALALLATLTNAAGTPLLREELQTIDGDYRRLLQFAQTGGEDNTRTDQHMRLFRKAISILQDTRRQYRIQRTGDIYGRTVAKLLPQWEGDLAAALASRIQSVEYTAIDEVFDIVWTSAQLKSNDEEAIQRFIDSSPAETQQYIISALTLSLLEYFDAAKIRLLLHHARNEEQELRARAVVGICIATQLYGTYLPFYPELTGELEQMDINDEITHVQHDFCLYLESERIQQKMQQEIIPSLIRAQQQREKLGFDNEELNLNDPSNGIDRKTRQKLTDSMREMANLFREGMDLNLNTFTALKGFPFFQRPCHWLAPYNNLRPEAQDKDFVHRMHLCDADKYSISLLLKTLSEEQLQQMKEQIQLQMDDTTGNEQRSIEETYHNVIQCLYRLLKRSPWSTEWPVVFSSQMSFIHNTILKERLQHDTNFLTQTGQTLLRYKHYVEAKEHLLLLLKLEGGTADTLRSLAACEEGEGNLQMAANYYRQANMLEPDNMDSLHQLQSCLARMGQHEAQLDCLLELEKRDPDNPKILTETGLCLMQLERWKEAQQRFFKMEFNNQRVVPSLRAIAWCALQTHDLELAHRYYHRILEEEPLSSRWEDYLNLGHTEWLEGHLTEALDHYHQYASKYIINTPEAKDALAPFDQDFKTLLKLGIKQSDIYLMHDLIASTL